ncbi:hypothetical protein M408DRAFT_331319 [Serendipita vermifera MAFF 305830]|uniref:Uncharacterized protein n=1 Tax=Serendipita vermifera MAFF 305830 TaxID=933852 RepID=A0A0C3AZ25_SERVB|nr:hypothetical protein M408DRAFT_331319 [Serendipita vermifera MAFF 305830]
MATIAILNLLQATTQRSARKCSGTSPRRGVVMSARRPFRIRPWGRTSGIASGRDGIYFVDI